MKNYEKEVLEILIDKLDDYEGNTRYGKDLFILLFNEEVATGSITCNRAKAKKWIINNFDDLDDLFLEKYPNPFKNPEGFQLIVYMDVANYLLNDCSYIMKHYVDKITLSKETIAILKEQLQEQLEEE